METEEFKELEKDPQPFLPFSKSHLKIFGKMEFTFFRSSRSRYLAVNMEGLLVFPEQRPPLKMDVVEDDRPIPEQDDIAPDNLNASERMW